MSNLKSWSLTTKRLTIVIPENNKTEIEFLFNLWTNPEIMTFVGFPDGLKTDYETIKQQLSQNYSSEFDRVLLIKLSDSNQIIGECKLGFPDQNDIAHTDIKLSPEFWGQKYGVEIKEALLDYLFKHTKCDSVTATPNKLNKASIRMQKSVGGIKIKEELFKFPEHMKSFTVDVPYFEYIVTRENWEKQNK